MKIVFVSNYLSPHQLPFCLAMSNYTDIEFVFVATLPVSEARKKLGYDDLDKKYPFVMCAYENENIKKQCKILILKADLVIVGTAPNDMIKDRIKMSKIVFRFSERQLKHGLEPLKYLYRYIKWHKISPNGKPCYLLCASAYAAYDFSLFGLYKNKAYKWGYFPETKVYSSIEQLISEKEENSILWVGRLLDWKKPECMLTLAKELKSRGLNFHINIIGTGPLEDKLKNLIAQQRLENEVTMLGAKKVADVRCYMEKSEIFICTSNRQEGWGAVVNEAMNSCCSVVVSSSVGAAPYLINNRVNGFIYKYDDISSCFNTVEMLLLNKACCQTIGKNAYKTIIEEWNADVAASRFVLLCKTLLKGDSILNLFTEGVCSSAPLLKDDWMSKDGKYENG